MDVRFEPVASRHSVKPIQPTADALHRPGDEPAGPAQDGQDRAARAAASVTPLQERVQSVRRELRFRVDETTGLTVVRVVEADTGTVIRQIPSRNVLEMHAARESHSGQLLREQA